jgi:hypothetical protein
MTTLTVMKARIADEISRADMTTQIGYAISSAITKYQKTRFFFNETDPAGLTFNTVALQETYTTENALLPYVYDVDDMFVTIGVNNFRIKRIDPTLFRINRMPNFLGQPYNYMFSDQTFAFSPIPNTVYPIIVYGFYKLAEPATDGEANNPWMTEAERLIRSTAKRMLYQDILLDSDGAAASAQAEQEAYDDLKATSNQMMRTGYIQPTKF